MPASQLLEVPAEIEILPAFEPVPAIDEDGDIADDFIDAVENLAPGAIATTGTDFPVYILVPGIGAETAIDAAALLVVPVFRWVFAWCRWKRGNRCIRRCRRTLAIFCSDWRNARGYCYLPTEACCTGWVLTPVAMWRKTPKVI